MSVACIGGDEDEDTSPSPTAPFGSPDATPTSAVDGQPNDPLLPPGSPTGRTELDAIIGAILDFNGDYSELEGLVKYTFTECTLELGSGGPPKCWDIPGAEQMEGFPVLAFPFSVCEGEWQSQSAGSRRILEMLVEPNTEGPTASDEVKREVFGVYTVPEVSEPSDWPAGDYAVVFSNWAGSSVWGSTVRVANGAIVSIEFGCGHVVPGIMAAGLADDLLQPPLAGLWLSGDGVILAVEEIPAWATEERSPAWHVVIDLVSPVGGYRAILVDDETVLSTSDGGMASIDDLHPGDTVAVAGVPLPWSVWRADKVIIGD